MSLPTLPAIDLGRVLPPRGRQTAYIVAIVFTVAVAVADVAVVANPDWLAALVRIADFLAPIVIGLAVLNVPTGEILAGSNATVLGTSQAERERLVELRDAQNPDL